MVDIKNKLYYMNREQEERHTEELAKKLQLPYINLVNYPLLEEILNAIPEESAVQYEIIPYLKIGSIDFKSTKLSKENLAKFDCVIIATDHSTLNYGQILKYSKMIFDTRNVYGYKINKKVVKL